MILSLCFGNLARLNFILSVPVHSHHFPPSKRRRNRGYIQKRLPEGQHVNECTEMWDRIGEKWLEFSAFLFKDRCQITKHSNGKLVQCEITSLSSLDKPRNSTNSCVQSKILFLWQSSQIRQRWWSGMEYITAQYTWQVRQTDEQSQRELCPVVAEF